MPIVTMTASALIPYERTESWQLVVTTLRRALHQHVRPAPDQCPHEDCQAALNRRSLSALLSTKIDDIAIAPAANIGDSSRPKSG